MKGLFLFLIAIGVSLAATSQLNIAVSDLSAKGLTRDEADIISDRLREELLGTNTFRVMERSMMDNVLKEQAFQQAGACSNSECQIQMGRLLGVDRMVVGSVGKIGNMYSLSIRMLNVESGEIEASFSQDHEGAIEGLMKGPVRILAYKLAAQIKNGKSAPLPASDLSTASVPQLPKPLVIPSLTSGVRGHAGEGLIWVFTKPDGSEVQFDISNSMFGGLDLRPSGSTPVLWYNHTNNFAYEKVNEAQYLTLNQPDRKAVLYGRLLHFGAYYASTVIDQDTAKIRAAMLKFPQAELDIATMARARAKRKTNGITVGAIGMTVGFYLAYAGLVGSCNTTYDASNGSYTSCSGNSTVIGLGTGIFFLSALYAGIKLYSPSAEENEAADRVRNLTSRLNQ